MRVAAFFAVAATLAACGPPVGDMQAALTNSSVDTGHPAVGMLRFGTAGGCGATLVGSRTALSAAHCVGSGGAGFRLELGGLTVGAIRVIPHPSYFTNATLDKLPQEGDGWYENDLSLAVLEREVTEVAPIGLARQPHAVGDPIILVGFGSPAPGQPGGTKRVTDNLIGILGEKYFLYGDGLGMKGKPGVLCGGDSGGPTLIVEGGEERLLGVHSMQYPDCKLFGYDMLVPAYRSWIEKESGGNLEVSGVRPRPEGGAGRDLGAPSSDGSVEPAAGGSGCTIGASSRPATSFLLLMTIGLTLLVLRQTRHVARSPSVPTARQLRDP